MSRETAMTKSCQQICSVCQQPFTPEFAYQTEYLTPAPSANPTSAQVVYYCSFECINRAHSNAQSVVCDVCSAPFEVELVSQMINHAGRRYHACSGDCRATLLRAIQGPVRQEPRLAAIEVQAARPEPRLAAIEAQPEPRAAAIEAQAPAAASVGVPTASTNATTWQRIMSEQSGAPRVLAVFNHKGGTAKTTTSLTIAAGLASCDRRVLLVDTDAQGNIAVSLDLHPEKTLYHVLVMGQRAADAIVNVRPNLDVLASNETLAAAELYLAGRQRRDRVLASQLNSLREHYDHIIVDCSPSLSLMNQNALVFADALLCPVACDYLSLVAVRQVLRTIKQVNRVLGHPVRLWGVLPTLFDSRARVCTDALATLREHFGDRCLDPIRTASRVKEAPSVGRTLFEHAGDTTAAKDYLRVVARLLSEAETAGADASERIAS
jgi:chromosome partitioning protein